MIYEQLRALGSMLLELSSENLVDLDNKVNGNIDRIYRVSELNNEFKDWSPLDLIKATNDNRQFKINEPYFIVAVAHDTLESKDYNIFVSIDKYEIDTESIAQAIFDGRDLPDCVKALTEDYDVISEYEWEFIDYVIKKSGAEKEQVLNWFDKIEFNYRSDWFDLYCEFISTL